MNELKDKTLARVAKYKESLIINEKAERDRIQMELETRKVRELQLEAVEKKAKLKQIRKEAAAR